MNFKSMRTMVNGEPRMQHCKSSPLSEHVSLRLHIMQSQPKLRSCQRGQHLCITCLGNIRSALYGEHTRASQQYRAVLLVSQNFNSVIDLQLYCRFAKGYSHNVSHCAYPLCTVSHNSKTLQVCVSLRCSV